MIRDAIVGDAAQVAVVHHSTWRHAYADLLPEEHWLTDTVERRAQRWTARLENGEREGWPVVAEVGGGVAGFAQAGQARARQDFAPVHDQELWSLYVLPAHHGSGAGAALLDAVLSFGAAQLWVADPNPRAQAFYRKHGFRPDGARFVDRDAITEIRMVRP
ncbi:GNAT family N-acetyltransferase [Myceligenerans pegani]|uniref:GNAT family N-acetyltransferase n=1 Tax=Myceligenerans pegani TaxID=2776917 RepID=UPI00299D1333|nr:GNAT family N-acetyltransferase [Myceligenerans sp. TRM 65318]